MRTSLRLFTSRVIAMTLTGAIAVILLGGNFTLINAQQLDQPQEQQSQTNQPSANQNTTAQLFQKPDEGFRVQVPDGWIIQDVNNSDSTLEAEALEGVGILAQLCLEEGQSQQQGVAAGSASANAGGSSSSTNITAINSTTTTVNLILPQTNQTIAETPAKIVEMTYTTAFAPNETRRGYFLLTATAATLPDLQTPKGYSILYEGNPVAAAGGATTSSSSNLFLPTPLSTVIAQVFDSF